MTDLDMKQELMPLSISKNIFQNNDQAFEFLIKYKILPKTILCVKCNCHMNIQKRTRFLNGKNYRCIMCSKSLSILKGNKFLSKFNIKLCDFFRLIFAWLHNFPNYLILPVIEVSEQRFIKLKNAMLELIEPEKNIVKIGGPGIIVQVGDTFLGNYYSSKSLDDKNGHRIIGGIENENSKKFFITYIPNRDISTIQSVFEQYIEPGSIIATNDYPGYIFATKNFGSKHLLVSFGFSKDDSVNINLNRIKNLWQHLKQSYHSKNGLIANRIPLFVKEFEWKKKMINLHEPESIMNAFIILMNRLAKFSK